jgi:hypothetical protein
MVGAPSKEPGYNRAMRQRLTTRAVGAEVVSPALQRGVSETNNLYAVP